VAVDTWVACGYVDNTGAAVLPMPFKLPMPFQLPMLFKLPMPFKLPMQLVGGTIVEDIALSGINPDAAP
jgi:hypothetical protein